MAILPNVYPLRRLQSQVQLCCAGSPGDADVYTHWRHVLPGEHLPVILLRTTSPVTTREPCDSKRKSCSVCLREMAIAPFSTLLLGPICRFAGPYCGEKKQQQVLTQLPGFQHEQCAPEVTQAHTGHGHFVYFLVASACRALAGGSQLTVSCFLHLQLPRNPPIPGPRAARPLPLPPPAGRCPTSLSPLPNAYAAACLYSLSGVCSDLPPVSSAPRRFRFSRGKITFPSQDVASLGRNWPS